MISSVTAYQPIKSVDQPTKTVIHFISAVVNEVFNLLQALYHIPAGIVQIVISAIKGKPAKSAEKVKSALTWFYEKIVSVSILHGVFTLGAGACELVVGLDKVKAVKVGAAAPILAVVRSCCMIMANIMVIVQNVVNLIKVCMAGEPKDEKKKELFERIKTSSILAILTAISFIISTATAMFGGPVALIILFTILGITTGGVKFLYTITHSCNKILDHEC